MGWGAAAVLGAAAACLPALRRSTLERKPTTALPPRTPYPQISALKRTLITRGVAICPALLVALSARTDSTQVRATRVWGALAGLPCSVHEVHPPPSSHLGYTS